MHLHVYFRDPCNVRASAGRAKGGGAKGVECFNYWGILTFRAFCLDHKLACFGRYVFLNRGPSYLLLCVCGILYIQCNFVTTDVLTTDT